MIDWKSLYSDEESRSKTQRVNDHFFHFLIARNPNQEDLINRIQHVQEVKKLIAHDEKNYQLTPLIIATMRGKTKIVEELLKHAAVRGKIDETDQYGWTALHHAALTSDEIFNKLIASGAKPDCRTLMRALPKDLKSLSNWDVTAPVNVLFEGKPLTEKIAEETFGMKGYRETAYYPAECLINLWKQVKPEEEEVANHLIKRCKSPRPQLVISSENGMYGLTAGQNISAGTVLGEYGGAYRGVNQNGFVCFSPEESKADAYLFSGFDAKYVGNATRFINCGFSNVTPLPFIKDGVKKFIFLAHQEIKKGEPILFNYGARAIEVNHGPQTLFNREQTHSFFKKGMSALLKEIELQVEKLRNAQSLDEAADTYLERMNLRDRANFPLDNPLCIIDLHISGLIPAKEWLNRNNIIVATWLKAYGFVSYVNTKELVLKVVKIDQSIKAKAPGEYPLFQSFVQKHCQTLTIMDLIKAMEWIEENPKGIDGIEKRLKSYDWKQDETNLYSYKNRRAGIEKQLNEDLFHQTKDTMKFVTQFVEMRKKQCEETITSLRKAKENFQGSELEKMLQEIAESAPKDKVSLFRYVEKITEELKE